MIGTFIFIIMSIIWSVMMMATYGQMVDEPAPTGWVCFFVWFLGLVVLGYVSKLAKRYLP